MPVRIMQAMQMTQALKQKCRDNTVRVDTKDR